MKTSPIALTLSLGLTLSAFTQTETETVTEEVTVVEGHSPEEVAARIQELETYLTHRQERATELTNDMIDLDDRIENRIGKIVGMLDGITDSLDSAQRVSQMKKAAIAALESTIQDYDRRRQALQEETRQRNPRISREELFSDIGKFDERIDKRVDQMLDLAKSMQSHKDYDKWSVVYGGGGWWDDGYYRSRNPRYYHNRSESRNTQQEVKQLVDEIKVGIERLQRSNRDIEEKLKANITPQYRAMLEDELERNNGIIETRESQMEDLVMSQNPDTQTVGRNQALNIESMIQDMAEDIEHDNNALFQLYHELNLEREAINQINQKLQALGAEPPPSPIPASEVPPTESGAPGTP
ncbi:MAG: hypothetical protein AAGD22_16060 [Verrucomicrobiota bacterium]